MTCPENCIFPGFPGFPDPVGTLLYINDMCKHGTDVPTTTAADRHLITFGIHYIIRIRLFRVYAITQFKITDFKLNKFL